MIRWSVSDGNEDAHANYNDHNYHSGHNDSDNDEECDDH